MLPFPLLGRSVILTARNHVHAVLTGIGFATRWCIVRVHLCFLIRAGIIGIVVLGTTQIVC